MNNPYKELSPYIESDAYRFKGRTLEIEEMYEGFDRNEFLVCHADSGEGKSSIIEAGLIPKMKKDCYFPIRVIFKSDEHFKNINVDFGKVICDIVQNEVEKLKANKNIAVDVIYPQRLVDNGNDQLSGWEKELIESFAWLKLRYARITVDNLFYTPVLIFDQFEEVFTNPPSQEWTDKFFAWLQELSTDLCPQRIVKRIEEYIGKEEFPEINSQKHFKAIFSLRSEYVGKLDYWGLQRHYIPLLKNNRYLLRPLTLKGAKEVITQQDGYDGLNDVADNIIDTLRRMQKGKNYVASESSELLCIPAMLLSVVCSRAFNMSPQELTSFVQNLRTNKDNEETVINALIEGFYQDAISKCKIPLKEMGVIEDALVNNEGSRQRISSHADVLKSIDFASQYMEKLKKARIIRAVPEYNREDDSVELVHDALCPVILKRKEQRQDLEIKARENQRLKKQRQSFLLFIAVLVVIASFLWMYQSQQSSEEKRLRSEAAQKNSEAERDSISRLNTIIVSKNESLAKQLSINEGQKDSIEKLNKQNEDKMKLIEYQRFLLEKENKRLKNDFQKYQEESAKSNTIINGNSISNAQSDFSTDQRKQLEKLKDDKNTH